MPANLLMDTPLIKVKQVLVAQAAKRQRRGSGSSAGSTHVAPSSQVSVQNTSKRAPLNTQNRSPLRPHTVHKRTIFKPSSLKKTPKGNNRPPSSARPQSSIAPTSDAGALPESTEDYDFDQDSDIEIKEIESQSRDKANTQDDDDNFSFVEDYFEPPTWKAGSDKPFLGTGSKTLTLELLSPTATKNLAYSLVDGLRMKPGSFLGKMVEEPEEDEDDNSNNNGADVIIVNQPDDIENVEEASESDYGNANDDDSYYETNSEGENSAGDLDQHNTAKSKSQNSENDQTQPGRSKHIKSLEL
ncbi:hypothetical protein KEM48_001813 [Puccinia striiformis f. sp. tritici PST-130]|nr:hypothetical protein KEM48_001813 [Puccinia striiformis f. sp. tritici PST-130]